MDEINYNIRVKDPTTRNFKEEYHIDSAIRVAVEKV
jgi:hypothetical protein